MSRRREKDSRVVLLLDEIEFLFDPLASVSHREFQPSRSPAASSATLQRERKKNKCRENSISIRDGAAATKRREIVRAGTRRGNIGIVAGAAASAPFLTLRDAISVHLRDLLSIHGEIGAKG